VSGHDGGRPHRGGLHAGLISAPQNDLRHTLHVGYDGAVFGDVSLIGGDQLPPQTETPGVTLSGMENIAIFSKISDIFDIFDIFDTYWIFSIFSFYSIGLGDVN